jgi:hypothetical protein
VQRTFAAGGAFGSGADLPRRLTGEALLGRVRSLASVVILAGTALFGSDTKRQLPAPCIGLRRHSASPTCENRAPTKGRGLGVMKHERDAFRRVVRRALTRSTNPEDVALTPLLPNCTPVRDAPSPQLSPPRGEPKTDILWIPVRARVARRVRALVTRSAGGPPDVFRRLVRSTKQRCERPTSAHSLESIGHPDRCGYRAL